MLIRLLAPVTLLLLASLTPACKSPGGGGTEDAGPGASSGDGGSCTTTALLANAGGDLTAEVGASVFLSGRAENGVPEAFQWMLVQVPEGSRAALDGANRTNPSFVADLAGTYVASLVVSDRCGKSAPDTVVIKANGRPVANAGSDRVVSRGNSVQLSGAGSSDPEGAPLTYAWSMSSRPAGSTASLSAVQGVDTGFTPDVEGTFRVRLVVSDGTLQSNPAEVTITVAAPGGNLPPYVSAGSDRSAYRRTTVVLTGEASDPEHAPLTYAWTQLSGPAVVLTGAGSSGVTFTTPDVEAELAFSVTVSDGELSVSDEVRVTVVNRAPVISSHSLSPAGAKTLDDVAATVLASDADEDALTITYTWKRNGVAVVGESDRVFPNALTTKGDVITSVVTASDGLEAVSSEQSVEIQDTLPSLTAAAPLPSQADHCSAVSFDLVASDPDGDPLGTFVVRHGPAGMTVSTTGTVSWDGCLPMFERSVGVSWRVGLSLHPDAGVGGVLTVNDAARPYPLRRTGIEIPISHAGLEVSDLDGNGTVEMLVASSHVLYELARSGTGYAQRWAYPYAAPDGTAFTATVARDIDGDGKQEIFFASSRFVVKLDGVDRREVARYETGAAYSCRDLEIADLSGDGDLELVCMGSVDYSSSGQRVVVLDAASLGLEWESPSGTLGASLALGNVDADAAIEIVTASGYVYDGATRANEWAYGPGFGSKVDTGDLDGNGVEEIVGMKEWDMVTGFSAVSKSPLWEHTNFDNDALLVVDFEGDAKAELLIGDGQWGDVTAYRHDAGTNKLVELFAIDSQEHGVTSLGVGDVDGDGAKEFVWGSGATSSGEDVFVIAGRSPTPAVEWTNTNPNQLDGPFVGGYVAQVSSTSRQLLFGTASTNSGYDGSRLVSLDPESGALRVSSEIGSNWSGAFAFTVSDYDMDGHDEALVATSSLYDGYFTAWDFDRNSAEWTSGTGVGGGVAVVSGDVNADGFPDLVALTREGHVRIHDVKNQVLVWESTDLGNGVDVQLADVDGDGVKEVIALADTALHVYAKAPSGPAAYLLRGTVSVSSGMDLLVADLDGDLSQELYVLQAPWSQAATVRRFDGALATTASFAAPVDTSSLHAEALGSGRRNLLLGVGGSWSSSPATVTLRAVDPSSGAEVWRSPPLPGTVSKNSVSFTDLVGTALPEIVYATQSGMSFTR